MINKEKYNSFVEKIKELGYAYYADNLEDEELDYYSVIVSIFKMESFIKNYNRYECYFNDEKNYIKNYRYNDNKAKDYCIKKYSQVLEELNPQNFGFTKNDYDINDTGIDNFEDEDSYFADITIIYHFYN